MHKNRDSYMSKLSTGRLLYFQFAASVHKTEVFKVPSTEVGVVTSLFYKALRIFSLASQALSFVAIIISSLRIQSLKSFGPLVKLQYF